MQTLKLKTVILGKFWVKIEILSTHGLLCICSWQSRLT